jgi:membrane protease YdiL (CAAX protease family)
MSENHSPAPQSFFRRIFISPSEPRLRAGWRLLLQTLLMIVIAVPVSLLASLVRIDRSGGVLFSQIIELVIFVSSIYIARRFLDKRSFVSLGLQVSKQTLTDILAGIGITFLMMGLIYAAEVAAGWLTFENFAWQTESITNVVFQTVLFFVIFIFVGWNEELLSRGYHLQTIASGTNIFWGMVISSSMFGLAHLKNPNATWVSAAGIFFAGIFLGYAYLRTGQLWLSIGLHIGWNFFEGVVFGFPVSGLDIYHLTHNQIQGPEIWTGGAFGPEAGLIVLPALVIGSALIWLYTRGRIASQENH